MIQLTDLQLSTLALAAFDADGPDARGKVHDILARAEKYQPYKVHILTDAMVKAAAMAVVQDIVWENGAPLTAESCWENAPAKLREKQLRQSRAALEAALKVSAGDKS